MRKYRLVAKKGEGTFSEVLKAQNVKDGRYHAIKCMKNRFENIDQVNNLREIQALRRLSPHEHIVALEEVLYDQPTGRLALVFELMDANLYELIRGRRQYLNQNLIRSYMWQLMKSLDHMHRKGIFHRDIKPENILIESTAVGNLSLDTSNGNGLMNKGLKLADFGSCRGIYSRQPYTEYISTRWYRAPECLLTDGYYGPEMDLWGAGCVMFEITTLHPLFPGSNEADMINRIHKVFGTPSKEVLAKFSGKGGSHISLDFPPGQVGQGIAHLLTHAPPDAVDLMVKLLKYDASERITAREAIRHPFFKEIREFELKQQQTAQNAALTTSSTTGTTTGTSTSSPVNLTPGSIQSKTFSGTKPLPAIETPQNNPSLMIKGQQHQSPTFGSSSIGTNSKNNTSSLPPISLLGVSGGANKTQTGQGGGGMVLMEMKSSRLNNSNGLNITGGITTSSISSNSSVTNSSSNNASTTQKKRKKRVNYIQHQRVQQSESVMKAYGVPKLHNMSVIENPNGNYSHYSTKNYMTKR